MIVATVIPRLLPHREAIEVGYCCTDCDIGETETLAFPRLMPAPGA